MARKRQKQPLVGWAERSAAHAVVPPVAVMGFAVLSPILRSRARHAFKEPAISGSGSARTGPPQVLNIAIADRGNAVCREPFIDRAAAKQRILADPAVGLLHRHRLDLARRCAMQGVMRDPGLGG